MHVTIVHVWVKPDRVQDFIEATQLNHEGSVGEPGNRRFDVLQDATDPTKFVLYEAFDTDEDAAGHKLTSHYQTWRDSVAEMMAKPREGVPHRALYPAN